VAPLPITGAGAGPILVVAATGDNATPYASSQALAQRLQQGRLLTRAGAGHTSYRPDDHCIANAVDGYLVAGVLPDEGTVCS
jgi:hypothetical protein